MANFENDYAVESGNTTSEKSIESPDELLDLKKKLADKIVDKLGVPSTFKKITIEYLIDKGTLLDFLRDTIIEKLGMEAGLITPALEKYREELSELKTKSELEDFYAKNFGDKGGIEIVSTDVKESNTTSESSNESSGKMEENGKEETIDNKGKDKQPTDSKVESTGGIVEKACQIGVNIANDNSYGYEWGGTGNKNGRKGFDCQGFVRYCYIQAGINVPPSGGCRTMKRDFEKEGFECIAFNKNEKLMAGDILVDPNKHTEMCISENEIAGAHSDKDKKPGDSGKEEISVRKIKSSLGYRNPKYILRYKGNMA